MYKVFNKNNHLYLNISYLVFKLVVNINKLCIIARMSYFDTLQIA